MSDSPASDSAARSIRRLSVAVWVLCALVAVNILVTCVWWFVPSIFLNRGTARRPISFESLPSPYNDFHDWTLEKKIQSASVIAVAKWQQNDRILKCTISEMLKQSPNTTFRFKIGEEFPSASRAIQDNTDVGDGQIMFFTGSPATFRYSATYKSGRIGSFGEMTIEELKAVIQNEK